jgi:Arylsulfotransferase (ASST)
MAETWSRRQLLKQTGSAAVGMAGLSVAGISLAGCGSKAAARTVEEKMVIKGVRNFVSRPDLAPPLITFSTTTSPSDPGYIMIATVASGPGQGGTMILRTSGELVWFEPDISNSKMNLSTQTYQGKTVLGWWEGKIVEAGYGQGVGIIADSSYQTLHKVSAANGLQADLHEFNITPQGTALVTAYREYPNVDLTSVGGPANAFLVAGVAQEIDIATGKLLFEWDSMKNIPLAESHQPFAFGKHTYGTSARPYDYFHINSLALAPDGDLLISSRNCWTVYKVNRKTGKISWRLGGKKSDFTFGPGAQFFWQHHVRPHGDTALTVFDNGAGALYTEKQSRGLILDIDFTKKHVTLTHQYVHPGAVLLSDAMGSVQVMPDNRVFVGWGTSPYFSEFTQDGKLLLDSKITKGDPSYRAFLSDWEGNPAGPPDMKAVYSGSGATVYSSWNGATNVHSWSILAGDSISSMKMIGTVPAGDFETAAQVSSAGPFFQVQAHDAGGHVLSKSGLQHIGNKGHSHHAYGGCGKNNQCGY